ncbi:hypothetical protein CGI18_07145 [Vibrio parahaemolyticus]|uniref:hypothetical protein n=1 Tax=Vibrio parahaemolyticus TaxID=670 RepID=UPI001123E75F|nr:hypothetical protein [Vibrio parahaemolyticus]TOK48260.1 hypothetical protein CGI18_07145 [Vibrio parahaemolyticus]
MDKKKYIDLLSSGMELTKVKREVVWDYGCSFSDAHTFLFGLPELEEEDEEKINKEIERNTLISAIFSQRNNGKSWRELEKMFNTPQRTLRRWLEKL